MYRRMPVTYEYAGMSTHQHGRERARAGANARTRTRHWADAFDRTPLRRLLLDHRSGHLPLDIFELLFVTLSMKEHEGQESIQRDPIDLRSSPIHTHACFQPEVTRVDF